MDLHHVPLRSGGYKSLRDFTRSSRIHTKSPLDLTVNILLRVFGSSHSDDLNSQLKNPLQISRSSRSVAKCLLIDQRISSLWVFKLRMFQHFNLCLPLDLLTYQHVSSWINDLDSLRPFGSPCFGCFKFETYFLLDFTVSDGPDPL
jgi:hypothetical protein